jgi:hypothetical protein
MRPLSDGIPFKWKLRSIVRLTHSFLGWNLILCYCVGDASCKRNQRIVVKTGLTFLF